MAPRPVSCYNCRCCLKRTRVASLKSLSMSLFVFFFAAAVILKLRLVYTTASGEQVTEVHDVKNFPAGY
jgi:hypothetical protein